MSNWDSRATIRVLAFTISLVPGTTTVQGAVVNYEIVHPDGRASQFTHNLDLTQVQTTINKTSGAITSQLLLAEGISTTWTPSQPVYPTVSEQILMTDQGVQS